MKNEGKEEVVKLGGGGGGVCVCKGGRRGVEMLREAGEITR